MNRDLMFSSKSDEWATPQSIFEELNNEFGFDLDPCATEENHKTPHYFTKEDDGLSQKWGGVSSLLQSSILADREMGREGLLRRTPGQHDRCFAHPLKNRHEILPRLHPQPLGGPLHQGASAVRRLKELCPVPVDGRHIQGRKNVILMEVKNGQHLRINTGI